ncbi:MAG: malto-oligosyltrehalose synthase [Frankiaceae bacterium]
MPAPLSTYRVQLQPAFDFTAAADLADYLAALGVTHLYASPYLQAATGSTHGYDVVDHTRASADLGGEEGRRELVRALREHGLGQVLDIVPNHMSVATPRDNAWWWDVLKHGTASPCAGRFDIDWDAPYAAEPGHRERLLLPVLGGDPAEIEQLRLVEEDGELLVAYHDRRFPVADGSGELGADVGDVLDRQHYALADWRLGNRALNYRRFFDVTDLAAIRVEDDRVFHESHDTVLAWLAAGELDGLRIDHPDGLADPLGYLQRLAAAAPAAWIVVEKILEPGERLDPRWPVAGTTGYDAMRTIGGLLVDPAGERPLTEAYGALTGEPTDFPAIAHALKGEAARTVLRAETSRLAALLQRAGVVQRWEDAVEPLAELLASFDAYRSYLRFHPAREEAAEDGPASVIAGAIDAAAARRPADAALYEALHGVRRAAIARPGIERAFVVRLQQTTGMVMAKGVEDTAFYRYHRLVSLNEVGGDPSVFGVPVADFHADALFRQERWPLAMTALSTHDTKRSEDVRARLAVLSELPAQWAQAVRRWHEAAARHRSPAGPDAPSGSPDPNANSPDPNASPPDPNAEYLLWQTLVGAWPIGADRLAAYLEKATREAKQRTSWVDPAAGYDEALRSFVRGVTGDEALLADVESFVATVLVPGRVNSLAQKLVQLTMPGVPDVYQGSECWDLSLVDPDNRRPVDFALRRALLTAMDAGAADLPTVHDDSGAAKLLVTSRALRLRRERPEWFDERGAYRALVADGEAAAHCVAFARADAAVTVVPRLPVGLGRRGGWGDTTLGLPSAGPWRDVLTGGVVEGDAVRLADLLADFPVALLHPAGG